MKKSISINNITIKINLIILSLNPSPRENIKKRIIDVKRENIKKRNIDLRNESVKNVKFFL